VERQKRIITQRVLCAKPQLPPIIRAFRRLSIRASFRARRSFALPLFRQPSTSGRRNTRQVRRRSNDGGWRDGRQRGHHRVGAASEPQTALLACRCSTFSSAAPAAADTVREPEEVFLIDRVQDSDSRPLSAASMMRWTPWSSESPPGR